MAYKTILVCLNEIERLPQLIAMARNLGVKFGAHITGLYVVPGIEVYPEPASAVGASVYDGKRVYFQEKISKIRSDFETAMKQDGLSFDFHDVDSIMPNILQDVVEQSRSVDLIVVSATNRDKAVGVENDFVENLVIAAGRPVLILPFKGKSWPKMEEIVLAWDDSREASRTVFDGVPFMQLAQRTHVVTFDPDGPGTVPGAAIAEALDRHGIKAKTMTMSSSGLGVGELLMRTAHDQGAGLIIMGAYGHSRFTEFVFGGATRHIIRNLNIPVLMSH